MFAAIVGVPIKKVRRGWCFSSTNRKTFINIYYSIPGFHLCWLKNMYWSPFFIVFKFTKDFSKVIRISQLRICFKETIQTNLWLPLFSTNVSDWVVLKKNRLNARTWMVSRRIGTKCKIEIDTGTSVIEHMS